MARQRPDVTYDVRGRGLDQTVVTQYAAPQNVGGRTTPEKIARRISTAEAPAKLRDGSQAAYEALQKDN